MHVFTKYCNSSVGNEWRRMSVVIHDGSFSAWRQFFGGDWWWWSHWQRSTQLNRRDIFDLTTTTSTTAAQPPQFKDDPLIPIYPSGKDHFHRRLLPKRLWTEWVLISFLPSFPINRKKTSRSWLAHSTWDIGRTITVVGRMMARKIYTIQHRIKLPEK